MRGKTAAAGEHDTARNGREMTLSFETAALGAALLGRHLPDAAERALRLASLSYHDDAAAERHLWQARAGAPDHPAVLLGFYRYYFYKGRLEDALTAARLCLLKAARDNAFDANWRHVEAEDAEFGRHDAVLPRFFLYSLKTYAYLQLRLGNHAEGRNAAEKAVALDPTDRVGAGVLLDVLARMSLTDDD